MIIYIFLLYFFFFFLMIRRPPRSTQGVSSAASDVYKRQVSTQSTWEYKRKYMNSMSTILIAERNTPRSKQYRNEIVFNHLQVLILFVNITITRPQMKKEGS
eukprot:TRINITY_DN673_c0_g1_i1.p3 TRINITY_DN673_c0_g1~~TRINITY_DN673_c0_g1_i1.p3  ORF type:complete len:102 (-),score=32.24 TRINITY_DN673_c0_g1_i1:562-867(-)